MILVFLVWFKLYSLCFQVVGFWGLADLASDRDFVVFSLGCGGILVELSFLVNSLAAGGFSGFSVLWLCFLNSAWSGTDLICCF